MDRATPSGELFGKQLVRGLVSSVRTTARRENTRKIFSSPREKQKEPLRGDLVEVSIRESRRGGTEGSISQILERARRQFTGTFQNQNGKACVTIDGVPFTNPVSVGDVRGLPLETDDKVFVEIVDFPGESGNGGEAIILERTW